VPCHVNTDRQSRPACRRLSPALSTNEGHTEAAWRGRNADVSRLVVPRRWAQTAACDTGELADRQTSHCRNPVGWVSATQPETGRQTNIKLVTIKHE